MAQVGESVDDEAVSLVRQLVSVSATVDGRVRDVLAGFGLTDTAGALLWELDPSAPPKRMRELAGALRCDPSNVTLIGDRLEEAGYLVRRTHPDDRRAKVLLLTRAGVELRRRLLTEVVSATPIPALTARERRQLGQLLGTLAAQPELNR